jgi:hypothetical protein
LEDAPLSTTRRYSVTNWAPVNDILSSDPVSSLVANYLKRSIA